MGMRRISGREFDRLMRDYALDRLVERQDELNAAVPDSTDRAAEQAFRKMEAMVSSGAYSGAARAGAAAAAAKAVVISVTAAAVLCAGSYALSPTVRSAVDGLVGIEAPAPSKQPGEYIIPSPGEDFSVTDEAEGERMAARWFKSDRQQVMVQIAYRMPEDIDTGQEFITVGGLPGTLTEADDTETLTLRDGTVIIRIQYFNADREELIGYAERLISMNGGNET